MVNRGCGHNYDESDVDCVLCLQVDHNLVLKQLSEAQRHAGQRFKDSCYVCWECKLNHSTENMVAYCAVCVHALREKMDHAEREMDYYRTVSVAHRHAADEMIKKRDEAIAMWNAHQKNVPCVGCVGGHDTFWKSVVESPQWKSWESSGPQWDVDECRECGHISQAHFQAFMSHASEAIVVSLMKALDEIISLANEQYPAYDERIFNVAKKALASGEGKKEA